MPHILIVIHCLAMIVVAAAVTMRDISKETAVKLLVALFFSAMVNAWLVFMTGAQ